MGTTWERLVSKNFRTDHRQNFYTATFFAARAALAFLRFSASAALRSGDIVRFALVFAAVFFGCCLRNAAHRFFCAALIRAIAAALITRFGFALSAMIGAAAVLPPSRR